MLSDPSPTTQPLYDTATSVLSNAKRELSHSPQWSYLRTLARERLRRVVKTTDKTLGALSDEERETLTQSIADSLKKDVAYKGVKNVCAAAVAKRLTDATSSNDIVPRHKVDPGFFNVKRANM